MFLPIEPYVPEGDFDEFFDRMRFVGGQNEIIGLVGLQHTPHALDVFRGVTPVALGVQVAEIQFLLQAEFDRGHGTGNFAGDEGFATARTFVVEENPVAGEEAVTLAVIHRGPVAEHFGATVRTARPEGSRLGLRDLLHLAIHFTARGLVEARLDPGFTDGLENTNGAHPGDVRCVFGNIETDAHVALRSEIVDLVGLQFVEHLGQVDRIGQISVVEEEAHSVDVRVLIKVVDARGIEGAGPADDAMDFIAFGNEQVGQIGAILTSDAGDECFFHDYCGADTVRTSS